MSEASSNCIIENSNTSNPIIKNITPECQEDIFSFVPTTETSKENILQKHLSVLRTDTEKATTDDLPPGSATIVDLKYYRENYNYPTDRVKLGNQYTEKKNDNGTTEIIIRNVNSFNKEIQFVIQAAPAGFQAANISNQSVTNSVYNCLYLAEKHGVQGIAFPIIGGHIFFNELKIKKNELYELLFQGVADYFNNFKDTKIQVVLFAGSKRVDDDDNFEKTFNDFIDKNVIVKDKLKQMQTGIFNAYYRYNNDFNNKTKITALVNAANTYITFDGISGLALGFKNMLGGVGEKKLTELYTLHDKAQGINDNVFKIADDITNQGVKIKKAFKEAVNAYIANPTAASSPPPSSPEAKPVVKKLFDNVIKELEGALSDQPDASVVMSNIGINSLSDFLYPPGGDASAKKNLNSAQPTIEDMVTAFETADEGETNFYLGACRSIEAAYELVSKNKSVTSGTLEMMRAKLLLNLRKNSLLLKVPARWDYAEMKMGVEPALNEEQLKAKYDILQQKCAELKGGYQSEEAYKLAEQLIPLNEKIESDKLEKKNKFVKENYPETKITYPTIADVMPGFKVIIDQNSENCGRAALANFFGTEDFLIKGDPKKTEEIFNLKSQRPKKIDMSSICHLNKKYSDIFSEAPNNPEDKKDYDYVTKCPTSENYSINVLSIVLQVLGYMDLYGITFDKSHADLYSKNKDKLNTSYNNKDVLGYLVNINKGHWVCYKREYLGSTTNSFYRIDSMISNNFSDARTLEKLVEYDYTTLNKDFIQLHPITKNDDSNNQKIFDALSKNGGNINFYKDRITENETSNKLKLFKKDVTSELAKDSTLFVIDNQVRIMNYLSNLPSNKSSTDKQITIGLNDENDIYGSIQSKIISLDTIQKNQVIDIFIQNIKNNLNKLNFITADNCNLRNIAYDRDNNLYEPDFDAKNRYYYSLTQTCNYKKGDTFNPDLAKSGYFISADTLLKEIDILFKTLEFTGSPPGGGGFKPRHNPITNHSTSKSKHNSSFKVSSSKTKGKSRSRSHTQRVK